MADIQLLRTFIAVYRAGTITRAATELHLTQPAVSLQVRALETQVGKPLFRRLPRGVAPTPAGHELAHAVAPHVDALEGAIDTSGSTGAVGDTVHIGGPEEFLGALVFPELTPMMVDGLRIRMFFGVDTPVLERLADGELDIAILTLDTRRRDIETQPLCFEYLDLVAAPHWREWIEGELPEGPAGAALLADVPLAAHDEDMPLVRTFWQTVFRTPPVAHAAFVANSLRASLNFAVDGVGATVLPAHAAAPAIERGDLVRLITPTAPTRSRLYLAWRAGTLRHRTLTRVHERITRAARNW